MININGVTDIKIEEVNHVSSMEPTESYFECFITKFGINGHGLGETANQALVDAIDWIESYNLQTERVVKELGNEFPF